MMEIDGPKPNPTVQPISGALGARIAGHCRETWRITLGGEIPVAA
jgi:hypothetical protein